MVTILLILPVVGTVIVSPIPTGVVSPGATVTGVVVPLLVKLPPFGHVISAPPLILNVPLLDPGVYVVPGRKEMGADVDPELPVEIVGVVGWVTGL